MSRFRLGYIEIVEWFYGYGYNFEKSINLMRIASIKCHMDIVNWFFEKKINFI